MALRNLILMAQNPSKTANFLVQTVGLIVKHESAAMVELRDTSDILPIIIKSSDGLSPSVLSTGYSPVMTFDVSNMEASITKAIELGGILDGGIKYPVYGKFASVRSPEGFMIGLFEPAQ